MTDIIAKLVVPSVPNYVMLDIPNLAREHGIDGPKIRVADLTAEQRDELAAQWRTQLDVVAKRQSENTKPTPRERSHA